MKRCIAYFDVHTCNDVVTGSALVSTAEEVQDLVYTRGDVALRAIMESVDSLVPWDSGFVDVSVGPEMSLIAGYKYFPGADALGNGGAIPASATEWVEALNQI